MISDVLLSWGGWVRLFTGKPIDDTGLLWHFLLGSLDKEVFSREQSRKGSFQPPKLAMAASNEDTESAVREILTLGNMWGEGSSPSLGWWLFSKILFLPEKLSWQMLSYTHWEVMGHFPDGKQSSHLTPPVEHR